MLTKEEILSTISRINEEKFKELNSRQIISVSKMEEFLCEKFDAEAMAATCAKKGAENPDYKYAGMTAEEILNMWTSKTDESKRYGSLLDDYTMHRFDGSEDELEMWKLDNNFDYDDRLRNNCTGFEEFWKDLQLYGYEYVGREITLYRETAAGNIVTGRMDCLFRHPGTGNLFVIDWKTTEEIKTSSYGKKMKGPAFLYDDCDHGKYTIQTQTYKNDLIYEYGLGTEETVNCCVVNLLREKDPQLGKFYRIYKEARPFQHKVLDDIIDFAIKKRELTKKIEEKKKA